MRPEREHRRGVGRKSRGGRVAAIVAGVTVAAAGIGIGIRSSGGDSSSKREQTTTTLVGRANAFVPETTTTTEAITLTPVQEAMKKAGFPQETIALHAEATGHETATLANGMQAEFWVLGMPNVSVDVNAAKALLDTYYDLPSRIPDGIDVPQEKDGPTVRVKLSPSGQRKVSFFLIKAGPKMPKELYDYGFSGEGNFGGTIRRGDETFSVINLTDHPNPERNKQGYNQIFGIEGLQGLDMEPDDGAYRETIANSLGPLPFVFDYAKTYGGKGGEFNLGTEEEPRVYPYLSPETVAGVPIPQKLAPPVLIDA